MRKQEVHHEAAKNLLEKVKDGNHIAIEPYIVLIEVVAAIKRRTGSTELAKRVKNDFLAIDTINFTDLESIRASDASEIAMNLGVRGMDAIVIQTAKEFNVPLITLDKEMIEKAKSLVDIRTVDDL
ncbi:MAG: type II toxin-antitoxin system VapC family toxin [ANME-2 cluster archaeon]|nr:type II toxin-antitoxin system VapC family toxin [ANME-2 cluster archaeon]MBC2700420.1 type II toxin-antitoxin system VapC family toxin [ANME-2 cluster archaeon]MBC2709358.1 type II toxin-antitoxin system VapC family toxin [ANME-2 cluster archaeon]MBC2747077.1 type II toxin-antitoxin system VapC family toxin [ANME-2 cluster archaeon]